MDQICHDVVIIGGGSIGCELGLELARKGRNVSVVARRTILRNLNDIMKASLKLQMKQCEDLHVYTYTNVKEITEEGVIVSDRDGKERLIKADTVIMAVGMKSRIDEANSFYGIVQDTNVIGDANRVGTVWTASEDGYYIAAHM